MTPRAHSSLALRFTALRTAYLDFLSLASPAICLKRVTVHTHPAGTRHCACHDRSHWTVSVFILEVFLNFDRERKMVFLADYLVL